MRVRCHCGNEVGLWPNNGGPGSTSGVCSSCGCVWSEMGLGARGTACWVKVEEAEARLKPVAEEAERTRAAALAQDERRSYVAGRHCEKGQHRYEKVRGSYERCAVCGSTRTLRKAQEPLA